ncbi:MAG TPA: hypothetical protein VKR26_18620 [Terriglobales bacterium]|jgi:hypothetical protein|nr:hypothetical protein [Terriglobales bacterium]
MQFLTVNAGMLAYGGASKLVLLAQGARDVLGQACFWLTVTLAVAGSALSAFCIVSPISEPRVDPYSFLGQWFIWLATPLLWATVAVSLAYAWLRPLDVLLVLVVLGTCRAAAQAICDYRWRRTKDKRIPRVAYLARPHHPL